MKNIFAAFFLLFISTSTQAVQELELKELPPLQPLNWCADSNGVSHGQIEPCGPGTTVGTSKNTVENDDVEEMPNPTSNPTDNRIVAQPATNEEIQKGGFLTLGFGVIFGIIWRMRGRSFLMGFFLGAIMRILLAVFVMKY